MGECGLAHAGDVFDEQMAAGQQASEAESDLWVLAEHHTIRLREGLLELTHMGMDLAFMSHCPFIRDHVYLRGSP